MKYCVVKKLYENLLFLLRNIHFSWYMYYIKDAVIYLIYMSMYLQKFYSCSCYDRNKSNLPSNFCYVLPIIEATSYIENCTFLASLN